MKELTVKEIAEKGDNMPFETVKSRIRILGIEPVRKVGRTNVYSLSDADRVINFENKPGRPFNKPEPEPPKPKRKPKTKK